VRGLGLPKESTNGQVVSRLAGDECAAVLTLVWRKKWRKGQIFPATALSYRWRRERGLRRALGVGDRRRRQAGPANRRRMLGSPAPGG
jgi:hypothetical protein